MPDPKVANGVSGGNVDATTMSAECNGYVSAQPDHLIVAGTEFATLRIMASSEADVTLVVRKPDGSYACNDDTEMTNPVVALAGTPAGTYQVWVGSYQSGTTSPYTLGVSELNGTVPSSLSSATAQ